MSSFALLSVCFYLCAVIGAEKKSLTGITFGDKGYELVELNGEDALRTTVNPLNLRNFYFKGLLNDLLNLEENSGKLPKVPKLPKKTFGDAKKDSCIDIPEYLKSLFEGRDIKEDEKSIDRPEKLDSESSEQSVDFAIENRQSELNDSQNLEKFAWDSQKDSGQSSEPLPDLNFDSASSSLYSNPQNPNSQDASVEQSPNRKKFLGISPVAKITNLILSKLKQKQNRKKLAESLLTRNSENSQETKAEDSSESNIPPGTDLQETIQQSTESVPDADKSELVESGPISNTDEKRIGCEEQTTILPTELMNQLGNFLQSVKHLLQ